MARTVSGSVQSQSRFPESVADSLGTTYRGTVLENYSKNFSSTDITKLIGKTIPVTTTPTSLDLTSQIDSLGNVLNFATVKHLQIVNRDTTNSLSIGGGTNGVFSALPNLTAGGSYNLTTTITVDSTHKILTLTAVAGTINVDVIFVGT